MKVFFGSAQEFKEVAHLFGPEVGATASSQAVEKALGSGLQGDASELTPELIELALNRIPLSRRQVSVLKAVIDAGPAGITTVELAKKTNNTRQQVSGVWGAL